MRELTRRDALASATALGAVVIAGCVAEDGDSDPNETDDDNGDTGQDPDSGLELVGSDITTTAADCGTGDTVEASISDGDIVLTGAVPASNPCHEAVLEASALEDGALSVVVGLEDTTEDGEGCASCTGVVDYEATLEFSEALEDLSPFESFSVEHGGNSGEVHTIEETDTAVGGTGPGSDGDSGDEADDDADDSSQGGVADHSIATTGGECTNETPGDDIERIDAGEETEFTQTDDTVTVSGSLLAPNPCHEAYLEGVSYDDGVLSLVVGTEWEGGGYCQECVGEIHYEATVSLVDGTVVDDVSVTHLQ